MKKIIFSMLTPLTVFMISCNPNNNDIKNREKDIIINTTDLSSRINNNDLGVISIKEAPDSDPNDPDNPTDPKNNPDAKTSNISNAKTNSIKYQNTASVENDIASNIPLVKIAEVSAPVYQGTTLRATHVAIEGNYAYVSFNVEGNQYLGAVDVINISDPTNPVMEVEAIFPNTDVSAVSYYNNTLYVAGASNALDNDGTAPAVLMSIELENGIPTDNISIIDMPSYVATDVLANANGIYGVSGDNGIIGKYNHNNKNLNQSLVLSDLRAIGNYDNKIVVLSGTEGIYVYNEANLNEINNFSTSQDIADSKRTLAFYNDYLMVSEGKKGLGIYNLNTGAPFTIFELPSIIDNNIDPNEVVTNAVTVENDHVFMANGAAGIAVYDIENEISSNHIIGTLEIDGSTNYVKSNNGYIFVASGDGGLKIIKTVEKEIDAENTINCEGLPAYTGSSWLNINSNSPQSYSGSASLMGLNINDQLTFCGSLAVTYGLHVNSQGDFYMSGSLAQGSTTNPWNALQINNSTMHLEGSMVVYGNMTINSGGTLEVLSSGSSITIYGDLILNNNATINFGNTGATITIHGNVTKNNNPIITGNFNDTLNKL
ncbi:hypothetical protein [Wenyingzhuangia sp. IMCC45467]